MKYKVESIYGLTWNNMAVATFQLQFSTAIFLNLPNSLRAETW